MMFVDLKKVRIYLRPGVTDMRKSINGLSVMIRESMYFDPASGDIYMFLNRKRNILKMLYWDRNGFCLWHKRLEQHKFPWSKVDAPSRMVTLEELQWLLEGIDFFKKHEDLIFSNIG